MNSRAKGKQGELELSAFLRSFGYAAARGRQFQGAADSPDVVGVPGVHIECKRKEGSGRIYEWLEQAIGDASPDQIPVVIHRRNRQRWICILRLEDFLSLAPFGHET